MAQRAKIAPKMLSNIASHLRKEDGVLALSPLFSQQKQSFWILSLSNMVQIHHQMGERALECAHYTLALMDKRF